VLLKDEEEVKALVEAGAVPVGAMLEVFPVGYGTVLDDVMGLDDVGGEAEFVATRAVPDGDPVPVVPMADVELDRG
jgi:hypothetical protein